MSYLLSILIFNFLSFQIKAFDQEYDFVKSFIINYDFSSNGKFTHEYHEFLLKQTKESMQDLETALIESGFNICGRQIIMGYQEDGISSYVSNMNKKSINDESLVTCNKAKITPAHNVFGFLTGFLLKDANWFFEQKKMKTENIIEHILPERIFIFNDFAYLLQKHAFGKDFSYLIEIRKNIERGIILNDLKYVIKTLIEFWKYAYNGNLKSFNQETLATQDILFSIEYAKYLLHSKIELSKLYIGPDITYPIEILPSQNSKATEVAQVFVEKISLQFIKKNNKKTAYIFCSFVDGVGKSTLLGNVLNYSKFKEKIELYESVDNTSSLTSSLYEIKNDVFILDLPAQLSHWVTKPDGYVFLDILSIKNLSKEFITNVCNNVIEYEDKFKIEFNESLNKFKHFNEFYFLYIDVVKKMSLKNEKTFIPFIFNNDLFIFNPENISDIKKLVPLQGVQSKGLKVLKPEHMIFSNGLNLPAKNEFFIKDVINKLKKNNIESLVLVDFLSMYPRTSRENIRVNFILQNIKSIFKSKYDFNYHMYKNFLNYNCDLYHELFYFKDKYIQSIVCEAIFRTAIFLLLKEKGIDIVSCICQKDLQVEVFRFCDLIEKKYGKKIYDLTSEKINFELLLLNKYSKDRDYEIYSRFSFEPLIEFSKFLSYLFGHDIKNNYFNSIWSDFYENSFKNKNYKNSSNQYNVIQALDLKSKDKLELDKFFRLLKSQWYALLSNLLFIKSEKIDLNDIYIPIVPIICKKNNNRVEIIQKNIESCKDIHYQKKEFSKFNIFNNGINSYDNPKFGIYDDVVHFLSWNQAYSDYGVFAFGLELFNKKNNKNIMYKILNDYNELCLKNALYNPYLSSTDLFYKYLNEPKKFNKTKKQDKLYIISPVSKQADLIRVFVRAIATLEMILKDEHCVILTRKGSYSDFISTIKLLELETLPKYFKIKIRGNLFLDYSNILPVISWEIINA